MISAEKRKNVIKQWIDARKEDGQLKECIFYITVPRVVNLLHEDETIKKVEAMLERNNNACTHVDTVPGTWNLNRDWIETGHMKCAVEYCGVYPADWNMDDVVEFERMETNGEIIVIVYWMEGDGKHIPNN